MIAKFFKFVLPCLAACHIGASAFEIKPVDNEEQLVQGLKAQYRRLLSHLSAGTHEELTSLALQCAESGVKQPWCTLDPVDAAAVSHFGLPALTSGVRWNDDPNNYFRAHREAMWLICLQAASVAPWRINQLDPIEYRSHYGDLQFLHGMARQKQDPETIRQNVLDWAQFAYGVAVGNIAPSDRLFALEGAYPFARHFAGTSKRMWTVQTLFANVGNGRCVDTGTNTLGVGQDEVPALALGALLHTVQDSYSHSHVERSPRGVVTWLDYSIQNPDCHGREDKNVPWIHADGQAKPAISWGAWLVRNAMLKTDWETGVRPTLERDVFVLDRDRARRTDDGGFRTGGQNCPFKVEDSTDPS